VLRKKILKQFGSEYKFPEFPPTESTWLLINDEDVVYVGEDKVTDLLSSDDDNSSTIYVLFYKQLESKGLIVGFDI